MFNFTLISTPIHTDKLRDMLASPTSGAFVSFEGRVRNYNEDKKVSLLEYEAAEKLCQMEARRIFQEAVKWFEITDAMCVHRTGKLSIGEVAIWIGVIAPHRRDAFKACQYLIDEIKHRLPIWKKEFYMDGDSGWINCETCVKEEILS